MCLGLGRAVELGGVIPNTLAVFIFIAGGMALQKKLFKGADSPVSKETVSSNTRIVSNLPATSDPSL